MLSSARLRRPSGSSIMRRTIGSRVPERNELSLMRACDFVVAAGARTRQTYILRAMKLQQLRYLVAVHENGLNITAAARQLHTSQPGVSCQLKLLEEELGFQLFEREGRALTRTTAAGER